MLMIGRTLEEAVVVDGRIVVRVHAVGLRSVFVKVCVDGGPEATVELRTPRVRNGPVLWLPLAERVKLGVGGKSGFMVKLVFEAPLEVGIRRQELLTCEEYARAIAPRAAAEKGGASEAA